MFGFRRRRPTRQYPPYYRAPTQGTYHYWQSGYYDQRYPYPWQHNYGYGPYWGYPTYYPQQAPQYPPQYRPTPPQAPPQQPGRRPAHLPGQRYIYPQGNTYINVIRDRTPASLNNSKFNFYQHHAAPSMSLKDVCRGLNLPLSTNATEVVEQQQGWRQIATVNCDSKDAEKTLQALGWSRTPWEEPPLWLVFHAPA